MAEHSSDRWQFWIDRGGTFTDVVAQQPDGKIIIHKLLSENPDRYQDAPLQGIREVMGLTAEQPIPAAKIAAIKMGTTVATNALLERRGDRTVLLITQGFRDALRIGYQNRPDIFARQIVLPEMLYEQVIEVPERMSAHGEALQPLTSSAAAQLKTALQHSYDRGIHSCAIVLMHGYRYPAHERQVAAIAQEIGFSQISVSHQVSPLMKLISRGDTTVVDAYLSPILRRYVDRITTELGKGSQQESTDGQKDKPGQGEGGEQSLALKRLPPEALSTDKASAQNPLSPPPSPPRLMFMQSNGGLTDASLFQGKDSILSGPAGGIVGAVQTSQRAGYQKIIGFDMGGTSTDVSHYSGTYERTFETEVAGVRLRAPMMAIHTVAAGGGSILSFDGARYRVGPASAGAYPGPACYRNGGPLAVTDCNVMVGKLQPDFFPQVFGSAGNQSLDTAIVQQKFFELAAQIQTQTGNTRSPEQVASGFLAIAVEKMANAIKKISVQRGHDVSAYVLCCFGGAGGQHACLIAETLGIQEIFIHPYAGVLSAYGMGLADIRALAEQAIEQPLTAENIAQITQALEKLARKKKADLCQQGLDIPPVEPLQSSDRIVVLPKVHLRYEGSDSPLVVAFGDLQTMRAEFEDAYQQRYGFIMPQKSLIAEAVSVEVIAQTIAPEETFRDNSPQTAPTPKATVAVYTRDRWQETPIYQRTDLRSGDRLSGPALIIEATGTNVVEPGWDACITEQGYLVLQQVEEHAEREAERARKEKEAEGVGEEKEAEGVGEEREAEGARKEKEAEGVGEDKDGIEAESANPKPLPLSPPLPLPPSSPDPVLLEIFNNLFRAIAEEMGVTLQNTSYSVNIKERLDFSCAIFDSQGQLVANAPHIPVHLGSMGESVQSLIQAKSNSLKPGDVYMLNNPYNGGTHLPDITVITPVFSLQTSTQAAQPLFYVASRGHHADVGGITPGSMPPESTSIEQEGVLIDNFQLVDRGHFREAAVLNLLTAATYPARNPTQNMADLQAQIAANEKGVQELHKMVAHYGLATVQSYMQHVQDNAENCVRQVIEVLQAGQFTNQLDDGRQIAVSITIDRTTRSAKIDFSGTSPQLPNNFNAPTAVCKAAVLYVFRTLVDDDIPLNAGCLKPLEIVIPAGCLLNPHPPAAVVAGNVETSQAITDALYGALGKLAGSQGTMNNFTFGNDTYQYYETICGGSGAGPDFDGTDAVHTHMTNSRLTDPEVLEWRFPVRLEQFQIRSDSGGRGRYCGGNGIIRRIKFLQPMMAAILSSRRQVPPFGLAGGQAGKVGKNLVERSDGQTELFSNQATIAMQPGDVMVIETPGGGGYGHMIEE
ncbi:hydantoinase B/oxoprolinase family protein [Almyronema epifaneia]|uniref:Hydantoinase B/oxoprolinase family protein n=1 Tax=Almyronema epifaneia S1 TaxID=2991925 RepID=A0ABW6IB36_9CYAN